MSGAGVAARRAALGVGLLLACRGAPERADAATDAATDAAIASPDAHAAPVASAAPCASRDLARTCTVAGLFPDAPDARLVLATSGDVPDTLVVTIERAGRPAQRLPAFHGSLLWGQCAPATDARDAPRLDRLAVDDADGDGRADLVVLAECMTGIGATGAQPFPAGAVFLADGRGGWRVEAPVDSALTDLAAAACDPACDVRALAREAVRRGRGAR